ncbi:MAG: selenocysteine-specific translation elongation factor [candidate division Zixibacteria bacterium]|nr:selenocysteine-specific translation elongation factor [candidate division Zixibacteria bacterium]
MFVIGTAGHVDHGKSTLVTALSGIDPDRLPEEKARGMTIDLGFAWMALPDDNEVGIVDVPGHERFVKNMIAGVGGIDAVLFVVAADDGWMPQSQEHLEILELLGVSAGIIVLTKTDIASADWVEMVEQDLRAKLTGTFLAKAPIIRTIASQGVGIPELKAEITKLLHSIFARQDKGRPRLFIDRVFTLTGKGTVVTGTLTGGSFKKGEKVEILPLRKTLRIRSLQTHKKEVEAGAPGSRLALNLTDAEKEELARGNVLVRPGDGVLTSRLAARVKILASSRFGLKDNQQYLFILGTQEVLGYVSLFDRKEIYPGTEDWAVFRFKEPICAGYLDHFIIRLPSPGLTLGGGTVYDPNFSAPPNEKSKRELEALSAEGPEAWIHYQLGRHFSSSADELVKETLFSSQELQAALYLSQGQGKLKSLEGRWVRCDRLEAKTIHLKNAISEYQRWFPSRPGLPITEAGKLLDISEKEGFLVCDYLVVAEGYKKRGPFISESAFEPALTDLQKEIAGKLLEQLRFERQNQAANGGAIQTEEEKEVLHFLVYSGQVVGVASDFFLPRQDFEKLTSEVKDLIQKEGKTTAGRVRDVLGSSRKLVIPLLEKLDALGITRRLGDERVLAE